MSGGLYVPGNFVFGTLVIVVNVKIAISSYLISFWMLFFVIGSVLIYATFYAVISMFLPISADYGTILMLLEAPQTYFTLMLFTFMFVLVDTGMQYLNIYITKWYFDSKDKAIK